MAFTTPTTFADGNVLSASDLNKFSSNDEYFYSLVSSNINVGFSSSSLTSDGDSNYWFFYRVHRYLHYKIENITNDTDRLRIYVDDVVEYDDGTNRIGNYTWTGYIDLQTDTSVAVGSVFSVKVNIVFLTGPNNLLIHYFVQSPNTSL